MPVSERAKRIHAGHPISLATDGGTPGVTILYQFFTLPAQENPGQKIYYSEVGPGWWRHRLVTKPGSGKCVYGI